MNELITMVRRHIGVRSMKFCAFQSRNSRNTPAEFPEWWSRSGMQKMGICVLRNYVTILLIVLEFLDFLWAAERPSVVQHCRQIVYRSLGRRLRRHPENIDGNVTSFGRQFRVAQQFPASISRAVDYVWVGDEYAFHKRCTQWRFIYSANLN